MSVVQYADVPTVIVPLGEYESRAELLQTITELNFGGKMILILLYYIREFVFVRISLVVLTYVQVNRLTHTGSS